MKNAAQNHFSAIKGQASQMWKQLNSSTEGKLTFVSFENVNTGKIIAFIVKNGKAVFESTSEIALTVCFQNAQKFA